MMQKIRRWIVVLLVVSLLLPSAGFVGVEAADSKDQNNDWVYDTDLHKNTDTYFYYMQKHADKDHPTTEIAVDITNFRVDDPMSGGVTAGTKLYHNIEGSEVGVHIGAKGEKVIFSVDVAKSGMYGIELDYFALAENNTQFLFSVLLDGKTPFTEANSCVLSRVYQNEAVEVDEYGDDLRPQAKQTPEWRKQFLYDQTGVYGTLYFYLEKGKHDLALCFDGTPLLLQGITLKQEPALDSYQDYIAGHQQDGFQKAENVMDLFQAETYYKQASAALWPSADKSSPLTQPFSYKNIKINYGGGSQWKTPGHWISWKIVAPKDGIYNLGFKYKQGYLDGLFSSRKIYIDGEVPFKELSAVRFNYTSQWENKVLGDENGPYSFYLTEGEHIITMENVVGDLASTMGVMQNVIANLNEIYLSIVMITGSDPDPYRDYFLSKKLPNLADDFRENADLLLQEIQRLESVVGIRGAENAYFEDVAYNLQSYADNLGDLTYNDRLTNFKNDINGLSAKFSTYQEQALDLDYIALLSADEQMPKTTLNIWQWLVYQVKSFFVSFLNIRDKETDDNTIRVWVNTGIDQYEIMKNMITDVFTPQYGIEVDIELSQASLVNAIASGTGPDVMLNVTSDSVVNLALRGAMEDLSKYDGYWDILDQYVEGAEIPFMLEGRYYGMPNTNGCSIMFVRTDIFESMGLKVPETWDDVYDIAQVLQRYNMTLGCAPGFATLLYQKGGSYFNEDLTEVLFDEDVAVEAMVQATEFYTKYGFPQVYDFTNRFRTGEMPIGIAAYSTYTSLKYTAPEISGLWEMYPIPGTRQPDGSINRTLMDQSGEGAILLSSAKNKDKAWEFIKWWSDAEAQSRYANDVEAALGVAARYATSNLTTLRSQGWTMKERKILEEQFSYLQFIPIVPGNYYVTRGLNNSSRGVIDHNENARELLTEWTIKINEELLRKRNEFFKNN